MAIPEKDSLLVPFSTNFNTRINANFATYFLTSEQAEAYTELHNPYIVAYGNLTAARADGTRSRSLTELKDNAKKDLLSYARELYAMVQVNPQVSDSDKVLLGIHVRSGGPSPIPAPTQRPAMEIASAYARTVNVRVFDPTSRTKRSKPAGAVCAFVYTFVGQEYPTDPTGWQFQGQATKDKFEITFPDTIANGAQVWICAAWVNRRGETGPVSVPVTTFVQGGLSMAA